MNYSVVTTQLRDTPLRAVHERLGATMTEFAGWLMPLRYGSETAEHNAVRSAAALFDLSHMGEIAVTGPGAAAALDYAVCGWPSALAPGRARYTMLCAPDGGVIDDLVIYRQAAERFLVVANAANTAVVLAELRERCSGAAVQDETAQTALIAIQGPERIAHPRTGHRPVPGRRALLRGRLREGRRLPGVGGAHRVHGRGRLRDLLRAR